jgi:hypothetical protein
MGRQPPSTWGRGGGGELHKGRAWAEARAPAERPLVPSQLFVDTYALGLMRSVAAGTVGEEGVVGGGGGR